MTEPEAAAPPPETAAPPRPRPPQAPPAPPADTYALVDALAALVRRLAQPAAGPLTRPLMHPDGAPQVIRAILGVMGRVRELKANGWNKKDSYAYVKAADLAAALQDAFVAEGLVIGQREMRRNIIGRTLFIAYQFDCYHDSGEYILNITEITGACRFEWQSGTTDDKAASKAVTNASKYSMMQLFKIPPDERSDNDADYAPPPPNDRGPDREQSRDKDRDRGGPPPDWPPPDVAYDAAPRDGPPDWDAPPLDDPPLDAAGYPQSRRAPGRPMTEEEANHRRALDDIGRRLEAFTTIEEASRFWMEPGVQSVVRRAGDGDYEHLRSQYYGKWMTYPPAVQH